MPPPRVDPLRVARRRARCQGGAGRASPDIRDIDAPQNFGTPTARFFLQSGNGSELPVPAIVGSCPFSGPALLKGAVSGSLVGIAFDHEIRVTVGAAAAATPEPATIGFLAMAGGVLLRSLRRRAVRK